MENTDRDNYFAPHTHVLCIPSNLIPPVRALNTRTHNYLRNRTHDQNSRMNQAKDAEVSPKILINNHEATYTKVALVRSLVVIKVVRRYSVQAGGTGTLDACLKRSRYKQ